MKLIEGDPFNTAKMKKSEQNIKDLGYFEKVEVKAVPGSAPDKTNLDVTVSEKSTGELSIGAGYSTTDGALGNFTIREKNFLGTGRDLSLSSTIAQKTTQFDFSYTEPYFLRRNITAGIDLFHVTRNLLEESEYESRTSGGALRMTYPLSDHLSQTLDYRAEVDNIGDVQSTASVYIQQQAGEFTTSAVGQTLTYNTTDSKLDPTEGLIVRLTDEFAGLGGDAQYVSTKLGGTYYIPVYDKWVFSQLGEVGDIVGWGGKDVRINERFFIGGATLRGFKDAGIGARDALTEDALGGDKYWRGSSQLDFPSGLPEDLGVKLHVFSDYASEWDIDQSGPGVLDKNALRLSVGTGVSWASPMGPVTVDFGAPIIRQNYDKTQIFRFNFGTRF